MLSKFKKLPAYNKIITCSFSIIILIALILYIGVKGLVLWVNTDSGYHWLNSKLAAVLIDTPYSIELKKLKQSGFSIAAEDITIKHFNTAILKLENTSVSINIYRLLDKCLDLNFSIDTLVLNSLPATNVSNNNKKAESGYDLSNLYFKRLKVTTDIKKIKVLNQITGVGDLEAEMHSSQQVEIENHIVRLKSNIKLNALDALGSGIIQYVPNEIATILDIDVRAANLNIHEFRLSNLIYKFIAVGNYHLQDKSEIKYLMTINKSNLPVKNLFSEDIRIHGVLTGRQKNLNGEIKINTALNKMPFNLHIPLSYDSSFIRFAKINGNLDGMPLSGDININTISGLSNGNIELILNNLHKVKNLIDNMKSNSSGKIVANFHPINQKQQFIGLNFYLEQLSYAGVDFKSPSISIAIEDAFNFHNATTKVKAKKIAFKSKELTNLDLEILSKKQQHDLKLKAIGPNNQQLILTTSAVLKNIQTPDIKITSFILKLADGIISASGSIEKENLKFNADISQMSLKNLHSDFLNNNPLVITKAGVSLTGTLKKPQIKSSFTLNKKTERLNESNIVAQLDFKDDVLNVIMSNKLNDVKVIDANAMIPVVFSLSPFNFNINKNDTISGNIKSEIDINKLVNDLYSGSAFKLYGNLNSDLKINGTIDKPSLNGHLGLKNCGLQESFTNIRLKDINGVINFKGTTALIESLDLKDRKTGRSHISGTIDYSNVFDPKIDIKAKIKSMKLLDTQSIKAITSADLTFTTSKPGYMLAGNVDISEISINLANIFDESIPELNIVSKQGIKEANHNSQINLNLKIQAKNRVFVRGLGVDAELQGSLIASGTIDEPDLQGKLTSIRGRFEEFGKQFNLKHADLIFQGKVPPSPFLDVLAQIESHGLLANITINGYVNKPEISLTSDPALPQDQILSRIMFGENLNDISPLQALQITQSIQKLSGKSIGPSFDPLGKLRSVTRLDDITIGGIGTENSKLGAGKYLSDKLYLKVEQGTTIQSGAANIEYKVKDHVYLESKVSTSGALGAGVSWGWDY